MKTIKIKFCDGFTEEDPFFLPILQKHYDVVISDNPDYLFYSVFGKEHLKYDCIKIFYTGEAVVPNFNECDYAMGFDYLEFGDRYLRMPLCTTMFRDGKNMMDAALNRNHLIENIHKRKFCSFVVSNENGMPERQKMFNLLSAYRRVDSGGRFMNNVGGPVENKLIFEHEHKFSICFENECYPGYTTEKIVDAFAAGTIPIYLGDPEIGRYFNTKAFVNVAEYESLEDAVEQVKRIDCDDKLYETMLSEPILCEESSLPRLKKLEDFLSHIINQKLTDARRRPNNMRAMKIERPYGTGNYARLCDCFYEACRKLKSMI